MELLSVSNQGAFNVSRISGRSALIMLAVKHTLLSDRQAYMLSRPADHGVLMQFDVWNCGLFRSIQVSCVRTFLSVSAVT